MLYPTSLDEGNTCSLGTSPAVSTLTKEPCGETRGVVGAFCLFRGCFSECSDLKCRQLKSNL